MNTNITKTEADIFNEAVQQIITIMNGHNHMSYNPSMTRNLFG